MANFITLLQIIIGISVFYVWTFRYDNVVKEFKQFGLNDLIRNIVGASKISAATLLIAGIWFPSLIAGSALLMSFFMLSAQFFHFKNGSAWSKRLPSLLFLLASLFIVLVTLKVI
jgi:hypothetical protein